jgi:hypothetical protein
VPSGQECTTSAVCAVTAHWRHRVWLPRVVTTHWRTRGRGNAYAGPPHTRAPSGAGSIAASRCRGQHRASGSVPLAHRSLCTDHMRRPASQQQFPHPNSSVGMARSASEQQFLRSASLLISASLQDFGPKRSTDQGPRGLFVGPRTWNRLLSGSVY